jgi:hypothetical protein
VAQPPPPGGGPPPPPGGYPPPGGGYPPPGGGYPPPGGTSPPPGPGTGPPDRWSANARSSAHLGILPVRAFTVGDILDGAFRLLRARFGRIALLVLVVLGPYQLLSAFLTSRWLPEFGTFPGPETGEVMLFDDLEVGQAMGLFTVTGVLGFVVHLWVAGALARVVLDDDRGGRGGVGHVLRATLPRLWALIGGSLLVLGAGVLGGVVLVLVAVALGTLAVPLGFVFGIPAMLLLMAAIAAATSLVVPVATVETGVGAGRAGVRALTLMWRRMGRMLGVTVLVLLVLLVVTMAISLLLTVVTFVAGPFAWVVDGISGTAISMITTPVMVFAAMLLYADARARLEGWDLELRAASPGPW